MSTNVKIWIQDPSILFTDLVFFPTADMNREQKFNALTRLAIIIAIIMYAMDYKHWLNFLLISVIIILILYFTNKDTPHVVAPSPIREGFTLTPTRINDDFEQTVVSPLFAEEHRILPSAYDMYENQGIEDVAFIEPLRPQAHPYGQYLTRTNFLPSDEHALQMNASGGAKTAREFANNMYMRNEMASRENFQRIYKKKIDRRFRHNAIDDSFSPFDSY